MFMGVGLKMTKEVPRRSAKIHDEILYWMIKETGDIGITSTGLRRFNILPRSIWVNSTKRLLEKGFILRKKEYITHGKNSGKLVNRYFADVGINEASVFHQECDCNKGTASRYFGHIRYFAKLEKNKMTDNQDDGRDDRHLMTKEVHPTYAEVIQAFGILMEYWESIPDDEKPKVDKRLKEVHC